MLKYSSTLGFLWLAAIEFAAISRRQLSISFACNKAAKTIVQHVDAYNWQLPVQLLCVLSRTKQGIGQLPTSDLCQRTSKKNNKRAWRPISPVLMQNLHVLEKTCANCRSWWAVLLKDISIFFNKKDKIAIFSCNIWYMIPKHKKHNEDHKIMTI